MPAQDERLDELRYERGYGAAGDDVNEHSPDQVQALVDTALDLDETQDERTDDWDEADQSLGAD